MVYSPGTLETDPKKQNMALQQQASAIGTAQTDIATNTTNIATNTTNITALQTAGIGLVNSSGSLAIASSGVIGHAIATSASVATDTSGNMPGSSNTAPTSSQGSQLITVSITPKSASSTLVIEAWLNGAASLSSVMQIAVFRDAGSSAVGSVYFNPNALANAAYLMRTKFSVSSGATTVTTFKLRFGLDRAGTMTANGSSGSQQGGGTLFSGIEITEYAP